MTGIRESIPSGFVPSGPEMAASQVMLLSKYFISVFLKLNIYHAVNGNKVNVVDIIWLWLFKHNENFSAAFTGGQS